MAGHSKWHNIQHRKGAQDKKRGKLFTKLIREITVAAKMGGADQTSNPRLRGAVENALSNNMPKDTVQRAIKRGSGDMNGADFDEVRYEGYGINGVAVIVDCLTDNRNRTVAEVRHAFNKCGGNLGAEGSVAFLFNQRGILSFSVGADEEQVLEVALEVGVEDVVTNDDSSIDVMTTPEQFGAVKDALEAKDLAPEHAEVTMIAATEVALDEEQATKILRLVDMLEDLDDVQNVYCNAEFPEELL